MAKLEMYKDLVLTKCFCQEKPDMHMECFIKPNILNRFNGYSIYFAEPLGSEISDIFKTSSTSQIQSLFADFMFGGWFKLTHHVFNPNSKFDYLQYWKEISLSIGKKILILPSAKNLNYFILNANDHVKAFPHSLWDNVRLKNYNFSGDEFLWFVVHVFDTHFRKLYEMENKVDALFSGASPRKEPEITSKVIKPVLDEIAEDHAITVNAEVAATWWSLDFLFITTNYNGHPSKICVEVKKSSNVSVGVAQLQMYIDQLNNVDNRWVIVLLNFGTKSNAYYEARIQSQIDALEKRYPGVYDVRFVVINCNKKPAPSTVKKFSIPKAKSSSKISGKTP